MFAKIVHTPLGVTLVGGGPVSTDDLEAALALAPLAVAVDGGADTLLQAGQVPQAVIGDFDSLSAQGRAEIPAERLFRIEEQDSTDFDKALSRINAPLIVGVGFMGARADHQLAAFNALVTNAAQPCVLIGASEIVLHLPARLSLDLAPGDTVSLFPMSQVTGRSRGLEWAIDGLIFAPDGRIGTSNRALGRVEIETDGPGLLALLPRARLSMVARALKPGGVVSGGALPAT